MAELVLGIDIGTTSVKVALVEERSERVVRTMSRETHGTVHSELGSVGSEQDVNKIVTALQICVSGLPTEELLQVKKIGICGQMHGVVFWKEHSGWTQNQISGRFDIGEVSALFTWQDGRCSPEFLASLPPPESHLRAASGMGVCTTLWLQRLRPDWLQQYDCAATVSDFVVCMLCGLGRPVMSTHNAASWSYFNTDTHQWDRHALELAGFPLRLLPGVRAAGAVAGSLRQAWYGIPDGTPVGVALGDLQCTFLSALPQPGDAVLNISTSAQLAYIQPDGFHPASTAESPTAIEHFPYFRGAYLAVAASLTGGNVLHAFVKLLQQWTHELGLGVPSSKIWEKVNALSGEAEAAETDLVIAPTIHGERHLPGLRGSVSNITSRNMSLASVYGALSRGVIANLGAMLPPPALAAAGVTHIVASGTAVQRNPLLRAEIARLYALPLQLGPQGGEADAAVGAALSLLHNPEH